MKCTRDIDDDDDIFDVVLMLAVGKPRSVYYLPVSMPLLTSTVNAVKQHSAGNTLVYTHCSLSLQDTCRKIYCVEQRQETRRS